MVLKFCEIISYAKKDEENLSENKIFYLQRRDLQKR